MAMKKKLSVREYVYVASMLFGMFFGAGNLIFPVAVGQEAGRNVWQAAAGLRITGVGLPLLGVAALGISRSKGLYDLSSKAGRPYGLFFTCLLYLTIGPFFAIPRCANTSFTVGLEQILPENGHVQLYILLFSALFFAAALFFSLRPGKILIWIGKILNPTFLLFLGVLVTVALISPATQIKQVEPVGDYAQQPFFEGFLAGYNTMDALAGLAFGIVVVQVICGLGLEEAGDVAGSTVCAGVFSCLFMGLIYLAVTVVGAQSRGAFEPAENGGVALAQIARYYLGDAGMLVLAAALSRRFATPIAQGFAVARSQAQDWQPTGIREIDELTAYFHSRLRESQPEVALPRQVESLVSELIDRAKGLTGTERVILRYYAEGYAVKDISGLLFISVGTVKGHNSHIYSKLGVDSYDSLKAYLDVLRRCERLEELLQGGGK